MSQSLASGRRSRNVWGVTSEDTTGDSTRFVDFAAFFVFGFPTLTAPLLGVPLNELGPALLIVFGLVRPAQPLRFRLWWVVAMGSIFGWLVLTSYLNDIVPTRRILHVALYVGLALLMAGGRVHVPSAARGLSLGLVVSVVASIAGVGPDLYPGRLSGLLGDPNLAGFLLTVLGCIAVGSLPPGRWRRVVMVVLVLGIFLTLSRTALLATVFALVWLLVHRRVGIIRGALLVGAFVWVVVSIPPDLQLFGPFADRQGSDDLRQRLVERERLDVGLHPFIGRGAGTARVQLGPDSFFYHSSYLAVQREGGLVLLVILLATIIGVFVALVRMPTAQRNPWYEASFICLMVVAVNLGEVLLELPAAVAFGFGAWHAFRAPPEASSPLRVVTDTATPRPAR